METPASCATSRVLPRRLASAPRYCLHCFSLSIVCIWWYSCSIDNFSILPMLASFPHYCQIICGSPLSEAITPRLSLDGECAATSLPRAICQFANEARARLLSHLHDFKCSAIWGSANQASPVCVSIPQG